LRQMGQRLSQSDSGDSFVMQARMFASSRCSSNPMVHPTLKLVAAVQVSWPMEPRSLRKKDSSCAPLKREEQKRKKAQSYQNNSTPSPVSVWDVPPRIARPISRKRRTMGHQRAHQQVGLGPGWAVFLGGWACHNAEMRGRQSTNRRTAPSGCPCGNSRGGIKIHRWVTCSLS